MLSRLSSLMIRRTPRSTRTDTLVPYTTLFRSNVIYAHEVLGIATLQDLYQRAAPDVLLASTRDSEIIRAPKNGYPKYCLKMATGTGKTWVLQALLVWQVLNANRAPESERYTKNFLIDRKSTRLNSSH